MAQAKQVEITQGSPAWHDFRRHGVCASDVPALYGKSPYKTKTEVYSEKIGLGFTDEEDKSFIFNRGHQIESKLREEFSNATGIDIKPVCFVKDEIYRASLDGYDKSLGVVEIKYVGKDVLEKADATGEIPEFHYIQMQAQYHASDSDTGYWIAQSPKSPRAIVIPIRRDEAFIEAMRRDIEIFWESVREGKPPILTEKDYLFLSDPDHVLVFEYLQQLKRQKDTLDAAYDAVEKKVKALATHPKVRCGQITITEATRSGSIDYSKVPEIAALSKEYLNSFRGPSKTYKTIRFGRS